MWYTFCKRAIALSLISATSVFSGITPQIAWAIEQEEASTNHIAQVANNKSFFDAAERDFTENLGEYGKDLYMLYRITEKLARANGLDERNWRLRLIPAYEINATASELNVLTFYSGLIDQLHGDFEAIACVVGHEMAHHTQDHIPLRIKLQADLSKLKEEADQELLAELEESQRRANKPSIFGQVTGVVLGRTIGGRTGALVGGTLAQTLEQMDEADRQRAQARAEEIYLEKLAALNEEFSGTVKSHELESDRFGYLYTTRMGLDPQGCLRAMNVLNDLPTSHLEGITHPSTPERIQRLQDIQAEFSTADLVAEGNAKLSQSSAPLKYAISRDGASIRIESRYGQRNINDVL